MLLLLVPGSRKTSLYMRHSFIGRCSVLRGATRVRKLGFELCTPMLRGVSRQSHSRARVRARRGALPRVDGKKLIWRNKFGRLLENASRRSEREIPLTHARLCFCLSRLKGNVRGKHSASKTE